MDRASHAHGAESSRDLSPIGKLTGGSPEQSRVGWHLKPFVVVEPDPTKSSGKVVRLTALAKLEAVAKFPGDRKSAGGLTIVTRHELLERMLEEFPSRRLLNGRAASV